MRRLLDRNCREAERRLAERSSEWLFGARMVTSTRIFAHWNLLNTVSLFQPSERYVPRFLRGLR